MNIASLSLSEKSLKIFNATLPNDIRREIVSFVIENFLEAAAEDGVKLISIEPVEGLPPNYRDAWAIQIDAAPDLLAVIRSENEAANTTTNEER